VNVKAAMSSLRSGVVKTLIARGVDGGTDVCLALMGNSISPSVGDESSRNSITTCLGWKRAGKNELAGMQAVRNKP
jgi:hypothetical protein